MPLPHPLLALALALSLGVVLGRALSPPSTLLLTVLAGLLLLLCRAIRKRQGVALVALALALALGALRYVTPSPWVDPCPGSRSGVDALHRVRIIGPAEFPEVGSATLDSQRQEVEVVLLEKQCGVEWRSARGRVRLTIDAPPLVRGQVVWVRMRVSRAQGSTEGFGWSRHAPVFEAPAGLSLGILSAIDRARFRLAYIWRTQLPEQAGLGRALSLGDQSGLASLRAHWARTGTAHILAISGLQLTLVSGWCFLVLRWLLARAPWAPRTSSRVCAAWLTLPMLWIFAGLTGPSVSCLRASILSSAVLLAIAVRRPQITLNTLGGAALGIVAVDPMALFAPGFVLSFAGALILVLGARRPGTALAKLWRACLFTSGVSAPICAWYFGQVSLAAPLINLVAVPWTSIVVIPLCMVFSLLAWVTTPPPWCAHLVGTLLSATDVGVRCLAESDWISWPATATLVGTVACALLLWLGLRTRSELRRVVWITASTLVLLACGWIAADLPDGRLHVFFPYVGQGDAAVVVFPHGTTMVVDAGGSPYGDFDPGARVLAPLLRRLGRKTIDIAVVTHPHPDHINGFLSLARELRIRALWHNGMEESQAHQTLVDLVLARGGSVHNAADLPALQQIEDVALELLHPRELPPLPEDLEPNDASIVMRLQHGGASILLTGDIEAIAEERLTPTMHHAQVLKVAHHGSRTSSSAAFLKMVRPQLAVISCGLDNRFGFPHPDVVARLEGFGRVLRTDEDGELHLWSNGENWHTSLAAANDPHPTDPSLRRHPVAGIEP